MPSNFRFVSSEIYLELYISTKLLPKAIEQVNLFRHESDRSEKRNKRAHKISETARSSRSAIFVDI